MEYLGPNRRGRAGKSGFSRRRQSSKHLDTKVSPRTSRKPELWDNSERFDREDEEDSEGVPAHLELSSTLTEALPVEDGDSGDDELQPSFSVAELEDVLRTSSLDKIVEEILSTECVEASDSANWLHLLNLKVAHVDDVVQHKQSQSTIVIESKEAEEHNFLPSSSSEDVFNSWFDSLSLS